MRDPQAERARRLLCALQNRIRADLRHARGMHRVAAVAAEDTIYAVDRVSERSILRWLAEHWPRTWPVELVMEGLAPGTTFPRGTPVAATRHRLILDPIDGTRMLMHDKRSAWSLAGLAPQRGPRTTLEDIFVAAMTELPTTKAGWGDQLSAVRGRGLTATRIDLRSGRRVKFQPRPSRARRLEHGFASFAKFFPEGKGRLAGWEEELWRGLAAPEGGNGRAVFDDQYISSGGQLYELIAGHDRFVADLRPLVFAQLRMKSALTCHPYDLCTALVAREAGCIIESPDGGPLAVTLDLTTPVAWVGYANAALRRRIRPALRGLLRRAVSEPARRSSRGR
ncbi:MAG TPA: inositol monophosphatase [Opitutaceae bacterium]|nr:inositol monophosphatase [Opitutaceae bacterium]